MITYLYWIVCFGVSFALLFIAGKEFGKWSLGLGLAAGFLLVSWLAYFFYFEQIFVKRWGGVMTISVPAGQQHIMTTWKGDNLWVENYDPVKNECIFTEYSRGNMLEGRVKLKNCNPISRQP